MTTEQKQAKVTEMVAALKPDLEPLVAQIEARPETTQGHYGDYMAVISDLAQGSKTMAQLVALALIESGANRRGVAAALQHAV